MTSSADRTWKKYGEQNPYYGVLTDTRFLANRMTDEARAKFFATGKQHVDRVLDLISRTVRPDFSPKRILDFGCGVGRLTIPFAMRCDEAVGVDISPSMLREARANADYLGVENLQLVESDDNLSRVDGLFSLVHTYIVLQHIPIDRGMRLIGELIDRVEPDGVGALHVTYGNEQSTPARVFRRARLRVAPLHWPVNMIRGRPLKTPMMEMNSYNLGSVFRTIQTRGGAEGMHVELTDHGGFLGALVIFRRAGE